MQFEFEDAEVASCQLDRSVLTVRLSAALVVQEHGERGWMPLMLRLEGVAEWAVLHRQESFTPAIAGRLRGGVAIGSGGERLRRVPVPSRLGGGWRLELEGAQGHLCQWQGEVLEVLVPAQCSTVQAYQC